MDGNPNAPGHFEDRVTATLRNARYLNPEGKGGIPPGIRNAAGMMALAIFGLGGFWGFVADQGWIGRAVLAASIVIAPLVWLRARFWDSVSRRAPVLAELTGSWTGPEQRRTLRPGRPPSAGALDDGEQGATGAVFDPDAIIARYMAGRELAAPADPSTAVAPGPRRAFGRKNA